MVLMYQIDIALWVLFFTWPGRWGGGWGQPQCLTGAPGGPVHVWAGSLSVLDSSSLCAGLLDLADGSSWQTMDWKPPETGSFIQHSNRRHRFKLASIVRCDDESIHCLFSQFGLMNASYPIKIQRVENIAVPINYVRKTTLPIIAWQELEKPLHTV